LKLLAEPGKAALQIGHSHESSSPMIIVMDGWDGTGAMRFAWLVPFAHPCGHLCGETAAVMYWSGRSLSFGYPEDNRPVFNVGIGTRTPETTLDVRGTTRTTVLQITSAREAKQGFAPVDAAAILAKVAALPLSTWAYTNSPTVRHLGPVAQDFHAAFALGDDDKHIATVDADGVALAAIQGLHQLLKEKEARLTQLESAARAKDASIASLESRLTALEQALEHRLSGISQPPARAEPESSATSPLSGKP
jgi:hypothetical protein